MRRRRRHPARTPQPHHPAAARCTRTQLNLAFAMLLVGLGFTVTPLTVTPNRLNSPAGFPDSLLPCTSRLTPTW